MIFLSCWYCFRHYYADWFHFFAFRWYFHFRHFAIISLMLSDYIRFSPLLPLFSFAIDSFHFILFSLLFSPHFLRLFSLFIFISLIAFITLADATSAIISPPIIFITLIFSFSLISHYFHGAARWPPLLMPHFAPAFTLSILPWYFAMPLLPLLILIFIIDISFAIIFFHYFRCFHSWLFHYFRHCRHFIDSFSHASWDYFQILVFTPFLSLLLRHYFHIFAIIFAFFHDIFASFRSSFHWAFIFFHFFHYFRHFDTPLSFSYCHAADTLSLILAYWFDFAGCHWFAFRYCHYVISILLSPLIIFAAMPPRRHAAACQLSPRFDIIRLFHFRHISLSLFSFDYYLRRHASHAMLLPLFRH